MLKTKEELFILSPSLNDIDHGQFALKAPERDGVIQVNKSKPKHFTELFVEKDDSGIFVARSDGEPLQLEYCKNKARTTNPKAFAQPIGSLMLARQDNDDRSGGNWLISSYNDEPDIDDPFVLFKFSEIFSGYLVKAQKARKVEMLALVLGDYMKQQRETTHLN